MVCNILWLRAAASQMAQQNDIRMAGNVNVLCDSFTLSWPQCCGPLAGNLGAGCQQVTLPEGSWSQEQRYDFKGTA